MDMGRSHCTNGVSGMILISIITVVLIARDKIFW